LFAISSYGQNPIESPRAITSGKLGNATITIDYGQPAVKGRKIWGALVPYGAIWRTGANETTSIELSSDVTIEGKKLSKGKYALLPSPMRKNG
jgi:hypothetical protein